jgi:hypothetical protein
VSAPVGTELPWQGAGGLLRGIRPIPLIHISLAFLRGVTSPLRRRHRASPLGQLFLRLVPENPAEPTTGRRLADGLIRDTSIAMIEFARG